MNKENDLSERKYIVMDDIVKMDFLPFHLDSDTLGYDSTLHIWH